MKTYKLLLKEIKEENMWGVADKDAVKRGTVAFTVTLEIDGKEVVFKKGEEVGYQYSNPAVIDGEKYLLVSANSIVWQK